MSDNCIFHFMKAFKSVFVFIRACPKDEYNIDLLKVFQKHIPQVEQLNNVEMARLRNEIRDMEGIEEGVKASLITNLDVYFCKEDIKDLEKLIKYSPVLNEFVHELIKLLQNEDFLRAKDLADAAHNFPEFLNNDTWSTKEYWKLYIVPYRKRWDKNFLNSWKKDFQVRLFF